MYFESGSGKSMRGSESEVRGLNTQGNPDVTTRTSDGGPENNRGAIDNVRVGGILARGSASSFRKDMGGINRGSELLRRGSR